MADAIATKAKDQRAKELSTYKQSEGAYALMFDHLYSIASVEDKTERKKLFDEYRTSIINVDAVSLLVINKFMERGAVDERYRVYPCMDDREKLIYQRLFA